MDSFRQPSRAEEASLLPPLDTSFSFASAPRTPEPQEAQSSPPPLAEPPRIRIKRRRPALNSGNDQAQHRADGLPSIELSESESTHVQPTEDSTDEKMLSPVLGSMHLVNPRFVSPPRTPVSKGYFDNYDWLARRQTSMGADLTRPSSAFSQISDSSSSFSSNSSSGTFTTVTDGCFTPLSERKESLSESALASPFQLVSARKEGKKPAAKRNKNEVRWTREMEDHLWRCYLSYLQDPTVTPFKTLPGVPPPIGVCHRVAHIARKTWRGRRARLAPVVEEPPSAFMSLDGTVMRREVSAPASMMQSEEPLSPSLTQPWPKESATRKHLRGLCRSKPTLSPHYQRLMQSRSPSPMESSSRGRPSSPPARSSSSFSTRNLNIDLTTSTAASMQPSGPLAQLASSASILSSPATQRSVPHQKSQSLEHDLSFTLPIGETPSSPRRLASPFVEQRRNTVTHPSNSFAPVPTFLPTPLQSSQISEQHNSATPSPAPELHHPQPRPLSNSMKRRAQYPLGDEYLTADPAARLDFLQSLFSDPDAAAGKRRVRSRGFSVGAGAMRQASSSTSAQPQRHISNLFSPPDDADSAMDGHGPSQGPPQHLAPPPSLPSFAAPATNATAIANVHEPAVPRLGSPFAPSFTLSNTFPRNVFPAGVAGSGPSAPGTDTRAPGPDAHLADPFL